MDFALEELMLRKASGTTHAPLAPTAGQEPRLVTIPLGLLDPDPDQPRKDLGNLQELESSIGTHGLLQPIIVEPVEGGRYRILAGERRFTACRNLQWKTVPCIVRTVAEQSRLELQLIENVQRQGLHPVEVAQAYRRLMSEFNLTQRDLAQRVGKSVANVNQALRLLDLAPDVLADVQTSEHASKSVLLELAKMPEPEAQRELWEEMKAGKVTARQARSAKDNAKGGPSRQTTASIALAAPLGNEFSPLGTSSFFAANTRCGCTNPCISPPAAAMFFTGATNSFSCIASTRRQGGDSQAERDRCEGFLLASGLRLDHQGRHQRPAMVCDHLAGSSGHPHLHAGQGAVA
jgi:ParB family chromosome partitioning protein